MKIIEINTYALEWKYPSPIFDARSRIEKKSAFLIQVVSDDGLEGWGEAACFGGVGRTLSTLFEEKVIPYFMGDVDLRTSVEGFRRMSAHFGQKGLAISALSGIEIALWDLYGKKFNCSVCELFGTSPKEVKLYASSGYYGELPLDQELVFLEEQIHGIDLRKFAGIKIKIGKYGINDDKRRIKKARELIGDDKLLIVDANNSYELRDAVTISEFSGDYGVYFLEEPIEFGNPEQSLFLRQKSPVRIAGYELEYNFESYKKYVDIAAVDIIQPDAIWTGGVMECLKIAEYAKGAGIQMIPHNFSTTVSHMANYQLSVIANSTPMMECDQTGSPFINFNNPLNVSSAEILQSQSVSGFGADISVELIKPYLIGSSRV